MSVIDPIRLHIESNGNAGRAIAKACAIFQTCDWRKRWQKAVEERDYDAMDRLDREYEMIGLP